ncbi:ABC transporter ATP-binding protein [Candidatus Woesearchaeota archaeon]|nr:ABC transporter ATP-binding protein [Candidatus Woesearchaeota archaeon]
MQPIIKLKDVWKIYDLGKVKVEAVRGITLDVHKKDFIAIMGPSGSGKSTLMNLIGCLDVPTRGKILLKGKDITKLSESSLANIRGRVIGFIFQSYNLLASLTAIENVEIPMIFQGVPRHERKRRAEKLLEQVGLSHRKYHFPKELSGGEQQRIAIARALANNPEVLIADEPTGNLDTKSGREVMKVLKKLNEDRGMTILLVTHDPSIARFASKVELISDGKIFKTIKNMDMLTAEYIQDLLGGEKNEEKAL